MPDSMSITDIQTLTSGMSRAADETSFEERMTDSIERIQDAATKSVAVNDSYGNSLLAVGNDDKVRDFTNYRFSNDTLNWMLWLALYNESWVFRRAIDKPSQDEARVRLSLALENPDTNIAMLSELDKYRPSICELLQWGALFGGSVACLMFDNIDDAEYAQPMSTEKLRASKAMRMYVVDRWYGVAPSSDNVANMTSVDFGTPMYYDVTLADGHTVRFHHDYVLRYSHRTAPKLVKNGMLQGWGYAEGSHIVNALMMDDKLKSSVQSLVDKSLIEVIKMSGMRGVFMGTDDANNQQLKKRLEMVNWGRNFNSLTFLDKDDEYSMNNFPGLGGLADLLQQNMWIIASALEMQGILFGDLKQGFSNDPQALERYDETILTRCETYVRPVYEKFLQILYRKHGVDAKVKFEFESMLKEQHTQQRVTDIQNYVQLLSQLMTDGVLDLKQYAKALKAYDEKGVIELGLSDEAIEKLDDKMSEELESIDV